MSVFARTFYNLRVKKGCREHWMVVKVGELGWANPGN